MSDPEHFAFAGRATDGPDGEWTMVVPASSFGLDHLTDEMVAHNVGRILPGGPNGQAAVITAAQVDPDGANVMLTMAPAPVVDEPPADPRGYTKEQFAKFMGEWFAQTVGSGVSEEKALATMNERLARLAPQFRVRLDGRTVVIEDA